MKSKTQLGRAGRRRRRSSSSSSSRKIQMFLPRTRSEALKAKAQAQAQALAKAPPLAADGASRSVTVASSSSKPGADPGKQGVGRPRSPSKPTLKAKDPSRHRKVTDYFPVRRSTRKNCGELRTEARIRLNELIKSGKEEGMRVGIFDGKGRGVITTRPFRRGDYVVEYHGDLIDLAAAKKREARYAKNPATGCYMYYFHYRSKGYCVDATKESGRLGRLINHSKSGNCQTKLHPIDGVPHLIVIATRDIEVGEELLYDYGDRSKASLEAYPWLKY
ncbi:N-lysine methyltransferase KMT5A-like [Dromiciops gliroides]|uniref:N-lysine methyltransferase KMT5A-like n=1 Tax=Dromiciops gliroides TaxID=33562 RepID=UPI001CC42B6E|nr:N-lysine methyltransferase KMT5A-like [Dromiciops gliroides]